MDERILVPFDGSPLSERALERALSIHPEADIVVLHVINPIEIVYEAESKGLQTAESWHNQMTEQARNLCAEAEERAEEMGCTISTIVQMGQPARKILECIAKQGIDHVIMGSHGRSGVSRLLLGSVAERVMRQSPVPVTIVR